MNNKMLIIVVFILLVGCSSDDTISSGTEIGNGYITAIVVNAEGLPVDNANVFVLSSEAIPERLDSLETDGHGMFSFKGNSDSVVNVLISKDSLKSFTRSFLLSFDSLAVDTMIVKPVGGTSLIIEDSAKYAGAEFFLTGTGLSVFASEMVRHGEHWILRFSNIPEMDSAQIVFSSMDSIVKLSGTFDIISGESINVLEGIRWKEHSLPSIPLVAITGWKDRLWWAGSTEVLRLEDGIIYEAFPSDSFFDFENLTSVTTGIDGTFWFANDNGYIGFILESSYTGILPTPSCTSSILSLTQNWAIDQGSGIVANDTAGAKYMFVDTKFTRLMPDSFGGVWASTDDGRVYHIIDSTQFSVFTTSDGLAGDSILDIAVTEGNDLWVVTESSIVKILFSGVVEIPTWSGVPGLKIISVEVNKRGVWFNTNTGLYVLLGNSIYPINWSGVPFSGKTISTTYSHYNGSFWLINEDALYKID